MSDAEARGKLRAFRRSLTGERTTAALDRLPPDQVARLALASAKGAARAAAALRRRLPGIRWAAPGPGYLRGAYLAATGPIIVEPRDVGQTQNSVIVRYAIVGKVADLFGSASGLWTLEVPEHALLRLAQRDRSADLATVVWAAHDNLLASTGDTTADELLLPAGNGAFVLEFINGLDESTAGAPLVYARVRTWLHVDQLLPNQRQPYLLPGNPPLGESLLLPSPLRRMTVLARGIKVERLA